MTPFKSEHLRRCLSCGLVFQWRIPTDQDLAAQYSHYSYAKFQNYPPATRANYRWYCSLWSPGEVRIDLLI